MQGIQDKWDNIYSKVDASVLPEACEALTQHGYLLPVTGSALDLACGLGGNALFLANHGLATTAIDISPVAIEKVIGLHQPLINARCEAINSNSFEASTYDLIVISHYLDRSICHAIAESLVPGGLLIYQTFVVDKSDVRKGPSNANYLLQSNELLLLFSGLTVLVFSDITTVGNTARGFRNQSFLIAQRAM